MTASDASASSSSAGVLRVATGAPHERGGVARTSRAELDEQWILCARHLAAAVRVRRGAAPADADIGVAGEGIASRPDHRRQGFCGDRVVDGAFAEGVERGLGGGIAHHCRLPQIGEFRRGFDQAHVVHQAFHGFRFERFHQPGHHAVAGEAAAHVDPDSAPVECPPPDLPRYRLHRILAEVPATGDLSADPADLVSGTFELRKLQQRRALRRQREKHEVGDGLGKVPRQITDVGGMGRDEKIHLGRGHRLAYLLDPLGVFPRLEEHFTRLGHGPSRALLLVGVRWVHATIRSANPRQRPTGG